MKPGQEEEYWISSRSRQARLESLYSEAVEEAASRRDTNYALGSVLNHVLLHQTVIGLEDGKNHRTPWPLGSSI
jgi:hypothetical protein